MMKTQKMTRIIATCVALVASGSLARVASSKTVTVDCSKKNASVAKALETKADELTVVISGVCMENVEIRRDSVTLMGASGDPTVDGLHGVPGDHTPLAVVEVWNSRYVKIQDLGIGNGTELGLGAWSALQMEVSNCRMHDNGGSGGHFSIDSDVYVERSSFTDNGSHGVRVQRVTRFSCAGCSFTDNDGYGLSIGESASASLYSFVPTGGGAATPTTIAGGRGVASSENSDLYLEEGSITVTPTTTTGGATIYRQAMLALDTGRIVAYSTAVTGSFYGTGKGTVTVSDVVQTATPSGSNGFDGDSMLTSYDSTISMPTYLYGFAKALVNGGSLSGDLACSEGANAFHNGGTITGTVAGCAAWTP